MINNVSVFGLGKLGAPLLASLASKGFNVIGVDLNEKVINSINSNKSPYFEKNLDSFLKKYKKNYIATNNVSFAIEKTSLSFIIVPTPSLKNGFFDNAFVNNVLKSIALEIKNKNEFHLINITSTVMPGTCKDIFIPIIEKYSGKKINRGFGLTYNPEFIALGNVINDILNPDMLLIGESGIKSGDLMENVYNKLCGKKIPKKRMNLVNAELVKLSVNTFVTTKISYANMLSEICENLSGANIDVVTDALGMDSRIGKKYLKGGLPYGGPCFPRDNRAISSLSKKINAFPFLAHATDEINSYQIKRIGKKIDKFLTKNSSVGILGLSYKNDTPEIDESFSIKIIKNLLPKVHQIFVYDRLAKENTMSVFGGKINYLDCAEDLCSNSDILLLCSDDNSYLNNKVKRMIKHNKNLIVFDFWRKLDTEKFDNLIYQTGVSL